MNNEERLQRIERFYEKSKERFLIDKNKNIEEINMFAKGIKELDPALINFDYPELDPEKLLPSLYKEIFIEEDYVKERQAVLEIYAKFDALLDRLITEAEGLMK